MAAMLFVSKIWWREEKNVKAKKTKVTVKAVGENQKKSEQRLQRTNRPVPTVAGSKSKAVVDSTFLLIGLMVMDSVGDGAGINFASGICS